MFETLEVRHESLARRLGTFTVSVVLHAAGISCLVLIPMLWLNTLPDLNVLTFLLATPAPPSTPDPPPPPVLATKAGNGGPRIVSNLGDVFPIHIPDHVELADAPPVELPAIGAGVNSVFFGPGGPQGLRPELVAESRVLAPPLPPPAPPVRRTDPVRIGGNVLESRLIRRVEPTYPEIARRARVAGVVTLEVTVGEEGDVTAVRVLHGNVLLDEAAVAAVRQWKYSPTLLNGEPVPVLALVTVIFTLR
jgi:periplasmic protein TonB